MSRIAVAAVAMTPAKLHRSHAGALTRANSGCGVVNSVFGIRDNSEIASRRESGRPGARSLLAGIGSEVDGARALCRGVGASAFHSTAPLARICLANSSNAPGCTLGYTACRNEGEVASSETK